ncbi:hypothetical protein WN943_009159 [Citrus x changshan-huyou]
MERETRCTVMVVLGYDRKKRCHVARGSFIHIRQKYSDTVEESFPTSLTPPLKEGHGITPPTSQVLTNYS